MFLTQKLLFLIKKCVILSGFFVEQSRVLAVLRVFFVRARGGGGGRKGEELLERFPDGHGWTQMDWIIEI